MQCSLQSQIEDLVFDENEQQPGAMEAMLLPEFKGSVERQGQQDHTICERDTPRNFAVSEETTDLKNDVPVENKRISFRKVSYTAYHRIPHKTYAINCRVLDWKQCADVCKIRTV